MQKALFIDVETASADLLWALPPEEMFRLGAYAWGADGDVVITDDLEEMRRVIREADIVCGHNIHAFDLTVIFGRDSVEPLEMALQDRIYDSWVHAILVHPAPATYVDRKGRRQWVDKPERAKRWYALDEQAYQLGVTRKLLDLGDLAREYGGYDRIPVSDSRYRDYLRQDVLVAREVARRLCALGDPNNPYTVREQLNAAIDAQNSRNGWRVDVAAARTRVEEIEEINRHYLEMLQRDYGLPTEGKQPLRTKQGKEAVLKALRSVGIDPDELPRTSTGAPQLGGKVLLEAAAGRGERAEQLASAIAAIGGLRPLAQSALDHVQPDGRVHPDITCLQRSGRKSTTNPGLTVWTSRGSGAIEKKYFVANADDELLVEYDYSQADARIVAAYSGDPEFAKRFAPGADAHLITAYAVWGEDVVGHEFDEHGKPVGRTAHYRQQAKALGHAYAYRAGARTLAKTAKQPLEVAERFVSAMERAYPLVTKWQNRVTREAQRYGYVTNAWGRRMLVDAGREYTQAPALYGQSGTREIVVDALIRMARRDIRLIQYLVAQVHDALVFSVPESEMHWARPAIRECMETTWQPPDGSGQAVHFPVGEGSPARNWFEAGH